jgi:hypothetical protein
MSVVPEYVGILLGLLFGPEEVGGIFLRNSDEQFF